MVMLKENDFLGNPFKTREDVEKGCRALLDPLAQHTSAGGALLYYASTATHYDLKAVALEAFARPLWGLSSLLAGGGEYAGAERWIRGLASGTDPKSPEYWGGAKAKDQRMVEMSPLSFAICMAPEVFYENQTDEAKQNIAAFLQTCIGKPMPDTNWLWFRVFANLALRSIGSDFFNPDQMAKDLARLEEFQLEPHGAIGFAEGSGGWSRDGPTGVEQLDYYSGSFAIQFAQLTYAKLCAKSDPERAARYRQRAVDFCQDLVYYFDENGEYLSTASADPSGSGIPFGRSMVYRFAIIGTFSALALADVEPLPLTWGHVKGMVLRHLRSWNQDVDIFRSDGTLSIGYKYDNMNMTENYNAPGSPYWCMKAFACLAAPADHPFWTSKELPFPSVKPLKALPDPGHIMVRSAGHTFLLSSGQFAHYYLRHASAKYGKFSYSSTFGFSCPTGDLGLEQVAGDSMLALRDISAGTEQADGETWRVRRLPLDARIVGRGTDEVHLRSKWRPWSDVEVETWLVPPQPDAPAWYIRVHKITSGRKLATSEGGWSTYGQGEDGRALFLAFSGEFGKGGDASKGWARAATKGGCAGILDLSESGVREGKLIQTDPNSNVIFSRSILPSLDGEAEGTVWLATGIFGCPPGRSWEAEWEKKPTVPKFVLQS